MEVDFNKIRLTLGKRYNSLYKNVEELCKEAELNSCGRNVKELLDNLKDNVENLRLSVATILCLQSDGDDVFDSVDFSLLSNEEED